MTGVKDWSPASFTLEVEDKAMRFGILESTLVAKNRVRTRVVIARTRVDVNLRCRIVAEIICLALERNY